MFRLLNSITPKSLYGRFLMIVVSAFTVTQMVSIYVFYYTHLDIVSKHMARGIVEEMIFIKNTVKKPGYKELLSELAANTGINFYFTENRKMKQQKKIGDNSTIYSSFQLIIAPLVDPYHRFKKELESHHLIPYQIFIHPENDDLILINLQTGRGVLSFEVPVKRIASSTAYVFTFWMCFTSIFMAFVSIVFFRNQVKSLKKLTVAAEKFGKGQEAQDLQSSGPEEIRSLTASFLQMQTRVKRQIAQRTETISAVSHDLRTPLTRMKLQIAIIKGGINFPPEIKELEQDIDEMQNLINEYLDFSISDNKEKTSLVKIKKFIEEELISNNFKNNPKIRFSLSGLPSSKTIEIKKIAFRRAVNNVLENALKFANFVDFAAYLDGKNLVILVADDGPGIPEVEQDNVFRPFYRLDQARNLDKKFNLTTGSGLGMSIALDAVILHGGKIALAESKMGGLQVKITIPC